MITGNILIENRTGETTVIDIEGIIGLPEGSQFEEPGEKTATYERFRRQIEALRAVDSPEIVVNIRSTGGNVHDALLIHDALRETGGRITTRCWGYTASAATLIAQAASPGRREMSANGLYLIHQSVSSGEGNARELGRTLDLLNQTDRRIAELYAQRSGREAEHFASLMSRNNGNGEWLSPREAKRSGLIDRIIPAGEISNQASEAVRLLHLPELPEPPFSEPHATAWKLVWRHFLKLVNRLENKAAPETVVEEPAPGAEQTLPRDQVQAPIPAADPPLRLEALATETIAREDPSSEECPLSGNALSYREDLRQFTMP